MYLMIQNSGIAPVEAFTLLGDSGTRNCGIIGIIGQFGSGTKHAINLLLRKGIQFLIYSGKTKLEFYYTVQSVLDANGQERDSYPVKCRLSGEKNRTIDCGWTVEFGALDWREVSMGLREFVSNALDCTVILGADGPVIQPEQNCRAKAGHTRVFVDMKDPDVSEFYRDLNRHFLHFSASDKLGKQFLTKEENRGPRIYREGVFVRELKGKNSAFDYNFSADQIEIDEARNSSEFSLRAAIAQLISRADSDTLATLFESMAGGEVYESGLDDFYLGYYEGEDERNKWSAGWEKFAGDDVIATESMGPMVSHIESKGHRVRTIQSDSMVKVAEKMGVKNVATVLGRSGAEGKIEVATTVVAQEAVDTVWGWLVKTGMDMGKEKPSVKCFRALMDGEGETLGYYRPGTDVVHIRVDLGGKMVLKVALEEVAHYITGASDCSRDFQQFFIDTLVEVCGVPV